MENAGFYKATAGNIQHAPNRVQHKDFLLIKEEKDSYQYPVHGWTWFNSREEAETHFISQGWEKPQEPTN